MLALTLTRAFLEILAFSSYTVRASSLCVISSSRARIFSYSSSIAVDNATVEGEGGGGGLHITNTEDQWCIKK
jgi:hypothetical protein